jgi:4-diphosphocytidyl-2-C-methyl-D-erythritol kinase
MVLRLFEEPLVNGNSFDSCRPNQAPPIFIRAPAKLNLHLRIVGRRGDGYHLLESLFWPINFCDEIFLKKSDEDNLTTEWHEEAPLKISPLPASRENLVWKALDFLSDERRDRFQILLKKKIPIGSGLGGGSSDAGTLLGFLRTKYPFFDFTNIEIANRLGADVPFFLNPKPAWVTGIGEECESLNIDDTLQSKLHFFLLLIPQPIDTKFIFYAFRKENPTISRTAQEKPLTLGDGFLRRFLASSGNDLEPIVCRQYGLVREALRQLRSTSNLYAGLSGSGSTCFGVFENEAQREKAAKALQEFCRVNNCRGVRAEGFQLS